MEDLERATEALEPEQGESYALGYWFEHRETDHVGVLERGDPDEIDDASPTMDRCWFCHSELAPAEERAEVDQLLENERPREDLDFWDNEHHEFDHEGVRARADIGARAQVGNAAELARELQELAPQMNRCWICHPELVPADQQKAQKRTQP